MNENRTYVSLISDQLGPNGWVVDHIGLEARMGSHFYGAVLDNSDVDIRGFFVPPCDMVLPFTDGNYIYGFGTQPSRFETIDKKVGDVDIVLYSVVRLFDMLLRGNPNVFNILLLREEDCSLLSGCGEVLLENRRHFLGQNLYKSYIGFADSCIRDLEKGNEDRGKLLALSVRQLLELIDLVTDIGQADPKAHGPLLLSIRSGEASEAEALELYEKLKSKCVLLENKNLLPPKPDELRVRRVLWECLETHFASHR